MRIVRVASCYGSGSGGLRTALHHLTAPGWPSRRVLALPLVRSVRLLAKSEVRSWPALGALAARTGALFVDRVRLRALPGTVAEIAAAVASGDSVTVFPEGTTWCGAAAGPFRHAAFPSRDRRPRIERRGSGATTLSLRCVGCCAPAEPCAS